MTLHIGQKVIYTVEPRSTCPQDVGAIVVALDDGNVAVTVVGERGVVWCDPRDVRPASDQAWASAINAVASEWT